MKKSLPWWIVGGVLILGGGVFFFTQQAAGGFLARTNEPDCNQRGKTHKVIIKNDQMEPMHTTAALCDTLTITNTDDKVRDMAFGVHDQHVAYDGVTVKTLVTGQSLTVTLNKKGTYLFHDHHQEAVAGDFTVK